MDFLRSVAARLIPVSTDSTDSPESTGREELRVSSSPKTAKVAQTVFGGAPPSEEIKSATSPSTNAPKTLSKEDFSKKIVEWNEKASQEPGERMGMVRSRNLGSLKSLGEENSVLAEINPNSKPALMRGTEKSTYNDVYSMNLTDGTPVVARVLLEEHQGNIEAIFPHIFETHEQFSEVFAGKIEAPQILSQNPDVTDRETILDESISKGRIIMEKIDKPLHKLVQENVPQREEIRDTTALYVMSQLAEVWRSGEFILPDFRFGNFAVNEEGTLFLVDFREEPIESTRGHGEEMNNIIASWKLSPEAEKSVREILLSAVPAGEKFEEIREVLSRGEDG